MTGQPRLPEDRRRHLHAVVDCRRTTRKIPRRASCFRWQLLPPFLVFGQNPPPRAPCDSSAVDLRAPVVAARPETW
jgi:hypothetical protein